MITIKYQYISERGSRRTNEVSWHPQFGLNVKDQFRFGFILGDQLIRGQEAYDKLMEPRFEGKTFLELIPDFRQPVEGFEPTQEQVAAGWNPAKAWPNPNYAAEKAAFDAAVAQYRSLLQNVLTLICKVQFPAIPDTGKNMKWWKLEDGLWVEQIVVVGKYPGGSRWVAVDDPFHRQYNGFIQNTISRKSKDEILRFLLRI